MARKKANYPLIEGLEITTLAAEGKAMGRWQDVVVFVPMTVPGDVVDVQIRCKRRRYMEGYVVRYVKRSPLRVEPFCEHFGVCGGCKWQNLPYEEQLRFKREQVCDQLTRIGKVSLPEIRPCLASAQTRFYRNKLEFTFADRRWLTREEVASGAALEAAPAVGFHIPGMFDKVLDIRRCWLQPEPSNAIRLEAKRFCLEHGYTFHNAREHSGLMRNLIVRTASTGEVMVIVVFGADDRPRITSLLDHLAEAFPQITSLFYVVNTKLNDSVGDLEAVCYRGKDHRRGCASRWGPSPSTRPIRRRPTSSTGWRATLPTCNPTRCSTTSTPARAPSPTSAPRAAAASWASSMCPRRSPTRRSTPS